MGGHVLTSRDLKPKPSYRKGKLNKRVAFVREIVREVAGYAPYEKRTMELLKVGEGEARGDVWHAAGAAHQVSYRARPIEECRWTVSLRVCCRASRDEGSAHA